MINKFFFFKAMISTIFQTVATTCGGRQGDATGEGKAGL